MKTLMLGNEAIARGLYQAGCSFISSYPGTPSTEISEYAAKYDEIYAEWAPNEKENRLIYAKSERLQIFTTPHLPTSLS